MRSTYVNISAEEMRDQLKIEKGWKETIGDGYTREIIFEYPLRDYPFIIVKVCTGIRKDSQQSRAVGQDAIRIFAVNKNTNRGWISTVRTYRTTNWRDNLKERVIETIQAAKKRCRDYELSKIQAQARKQQNASYLAGEIEAETRAEMEVLQIESRQM